MKSFEYFEPRNVAEAVSLLEGFGDAGRALAGGTDLIVNMRQKTEEPKYVVNLKTIPGLNHVVYQEGEGLRIGALATIASIMLNSSVKVKYPALWASAEAFGTPIIRNRATVGGNLCNASPAADMAPPLMVYNAILKIESTSGVRTVPIDQFFTGVNQTVLGRGDVLVEVEVPYLPGNARSLYIKHGRRKSHDTSIVSVAACLWMESGTGAVSDARIALGAVAPVPLRAVAAEDAVRGQVLTVSLIEQASSLAAEATQPITDVRSTAEYRKEIAKVLTRRALTQLAAEIL